LKRNFSYGLITGGALILSATPGLTATTELVEAARKEGSVTIYSATDQAQAQAALDAFAKKYPDIRVDYNDIGTNGVYNRVISEAAAGQVGGDLFWTSAISHPTNQQKLPLCLVGPYIRTSSTQPRSNRSA
jgi:iron(III) transport system substrate-binding protein